MTDEQMRRDKAMAQDADERYRGVTQKDDREVVYDEEPERERSPRNREKSGRERSKQAKKKRGAGTAMKVFLYFVLGVSTFVGCLGVMLSVLMYEDGFYTESWESTLSHFLYEQASDDLLYMRDMYQYEQYDYIKEYCNKHNMDMGVYVGDYCQWGSDTKPSGFIFQTPLVFSNGESMNWVRNEASQSSVYSWGDTEVVYKLYVDPTYGISDSYLASYTVARNLADLQYAIPFIAVGGILLCILSFVCLMCFAGRKKGVDGYSLSAIGAVPFDLLTCVFAVVAALPFVTVFHDFSTGNYYVYALILSLIVMALVIWCTLFCVETASRLKVGGWWRNTILYKGIRLVIRLIRWVAGVVAGFLRMLPLIWQAEAVYAAICFLEFCGLVLCRHQIGGGLISLWLLEKILLFGLVTYAAILCNKLQHGSEMLAEGKISEKVDTRGMFGALKDHGENLNRINQGIAKAVEERMKSEHLKTELITNVSHDIKTPITSIINYAGLLGDMEQGADAEGDYILVERAKFHEYTDVVLRQSARLKKLLEDLVEASKATTGNLEVELAPCEVGVMLTQAVGEYEKRFEQKGLEHIVRQPEESIYILADGRHLWRIFDNLLNNICKYSLENTRVYLSVTHGNGQVEITFRNMSKYLLDVNPHELEERFMRGDKSRHMEGNGLGLSITKSLTELQNGTLDIVVDGDLFKVILRFAEISA